MRAPAVAALAALSLASPSAAARYDWDALGAEFCRLTLAGDLAALRPMLSRELDADIAAAERNPALPPARVLFQSYANLVPTCVAITRNAALVEIRRAGPSGPSWREWLVVVPEPDGTTRIDDVLFATRKSDTLRARLKALAGTR